MAGHISFSSKRKLIADSNKAMFIWVAIMAAVVGLCVVLSITLFQQISFHGRVINKLSNTKEVMGRNIEAAKSLADDVRALEANSRLSQSVAFEGERPLQVILDALPADRNTLALGASLQERLVTGVSGLKISMIDVDGDASSSEIVSDSPAETIPLTIRVTSEGADGLKQLLLRLERSVRVIDIDRLVIDVTGDNRFDLTIQGHAYYNEPVEYNLTKEVVPR